MSFTEFNTVEQMILDAVENLGHNIIRPQRNSERSGALGFFSVRFTGE